MVDSDGRAAQRVDGAFPNWVDTLGKTRIWLKPKERMVVALCTEQLVRLDNEGRPLPPPHPFLFYHVTQVKPGTYSLGAAVQFGSGLTAPKPAEAPKQEIFAAKGEWTGQLRTGVAQISLFEAAAK
jgi:hypothetical protein